MFNQYEVKKNNDQVVLATKAKWPHFCFISCGLYILNLWLISPILKSYRENITLILVLHIPFLLVVTFFFIAAKWRSTIVFNKRGISLLTRKTLKSTECFYSYKDLKKIKFKLDYYDLTLQFSTIQFVRIKAVEGSAERYISHFNPSKDFLSEVRACLKKFEAKNVIVEY